MFLSLNEQMDILRKGTVEIIPEEELAKKKEEEEAAAKKKAEEEQAFFLHRFLLLAIEYGGDFIKVFNEQTHTLVELKAAK